MVGGDRFGAMRTVEEHLAAVLAAAGPLPPVRLSLDEAAGLLATCNWSETHEERGRRRGWSDTPFSDSPSLQK